MNQQAAISTATDFIAGEESFSPSPYFDVNGYAIGYGNHYYEDGSSVSRDDDPIDETRGRELLAFFVQDNATAIANQLGVDLNSNQLAALTSLRYNCGTITTSLLSLINSGADSGTVADKLANTCTTSGGVSNTVLIGRRAREAELYSSPALLDSLPAGSGSILIAAGIALVVAFFVLRK